MAEEKARRSRRSLRSRLLLMLLLSFAPLMIGMTLLFAETMASQRRADAEMLSYTAQEISDDLEKYASGIYNVSDSFSTDERLLAVIDKDYAENLQEKQRVTVFILNALFESYNRLQQQVKMAAVYVVPKRELFDFIDPNQDAALVIGELDRLNVNDKEKLGRFYWYPLEENFLTTSAYGEVRRDHVVFGSRRVYSALKSGYPYIHIFAVEEKELYELYRLQAERLQAEVYVLDAAGGLISSTEEDTVARCAAPEEVTRLAAGLRDGSGQTEYRDTGYNVACATSTLSGWTTVVLVPGGMVTGVTQALYLKIVGILVFCVGLCAVLLLVLYRRFMQPLGQLEQAMRQADSGNLRAYVKPQGQAEMVRMMETYNYMLDGIRTGIDERMRMERMKQDLEMQVLMNQINPHFLYNTLESIVWMAGAAGRSDIAKLAASLGKLYRLSISGGLFVSLQQELDHVQMYMNIQQSRYGNKVAYDVRLHGVDSTQCDTLKLILQPLVENSLLYGMEGLDRVLSVRVSARRRGGRLVLTVTDNGVGMDEAALARVREQIANGRRGQDAVRNRRSTGIGMHNIDARLKLYTRQDSGLQIASIQGLGTQVTLELPWRDHQPPEG